MNILLILFVSIVLLIDFIKLKKDDKKVIYIYIAITAIALAIALMDKYQFFKTSPLETWIEEMKPLTDWIEAQLK